MACRVGMSTDPQERMAYWCRTEGHTGEQILASGLTYGQASDMERREANRLGCYWHGGGDYIPGPKWSVYHVWGGRIR